MAIIMNGRVHFLEEEYQNPLNAKREGSIKFLRDKLWGVSRNPVYQNKLDYFVRLFSEDIPTFHRMNKLESEGWDIRLWRKPRFTDVHGFRSPAYGLTNFDRKLIFINPELLEMPVKNIAKAILHEVYHASEEEHAVSIYQSFERPFSYQDDPHERQADVFVDDVLMRSFPEIYAMSVIQKHIARACDHDEGLLLRRAATDQVITRGFQEAMRDMRLTGTGAVKASVNYENEIAVCTLSSGNRSFDFGWRHR